MQESSMEMPIAAANEDYGADSADQRPGVWGLRIQEKSTSRLPSMVGSEVSSEEGDEANNTEQTFSLCPQQLSSEILTSPKLKREPLRFEFAGLTIWLELEQYSSDLSNAVEYFADVHGLLPIPQPHITALYGMTHLSTPEAVSLFRSIPSHLPEGRWPKFQKPIGVLHDIAVNGVNGEFCDIAWSELTFATNEKHESAVDTLYDIFYGAHSKELASRQRPFKPHLSIAYDNPEGTVLNLGEAMSYVLNHPSLLGMGRNVTGISLWSLHGPMAKWECIDRIRF